MFDPPPANLYESPRLQAVLGPALRPGGLELTRRALSFCDLPADSAVADIGCGTGMTAQFLRRNRRLKACGIDLSPVLLAKARRHAAGLPLIRGTANCLPFRRNCLSAVICECVLSLVADTGQAWRELHRVLVCGGYLVVADVYARAPEHARRLQSVFAAGCLRGARSREALVSRLDETGFSLLVWEDHSQDLKRLAAQLAFAGRPWQTFWQGAGEGVTRDDARAVIRSARPGYFLMVARKRGKP